MMMYLITVLMEVVCFVAATSGLRGFNSIWPWGCGFMSFNMNKGKLNGSRFIIDLFVFCCMFHHFEGIAMLWLFYSHTYSFVPYNCYGVGVLLNRFPMIGLLWWMDLGSKFKSKNPWLIWITLLDMSTKYEGEPMQISWNLCLIQTKFITYDLWDR